MEYLIAGLAFGCVFLVVIAIASALETPVAEQRLVRLGGTASDSEIPTRSAESLVRPSHSGLASFFQRIGRRNDGEQSGPLRDRLTFAGFRSLSAPAIFFGVRVTLAVALPMAAVAVPAVWSLSGKFQMSLLMVLTAVGYIIPSVFVDSRAKKRQGEMTRVLPDSLDLMVVCVEAGFGINQTLLRVSEEFRTKSALLADEFDLVAQETRAGKGTIDALRALAERVGIADLSSLVALLVQTERFGTSMATALRVHADAMRVRRMQYAEERAQKATLKLILPSTMIFAALMMIFLAPGMQAFIGALAN